MDKITPKILIVDNVKASHYMLKNAIKSENYEIFDAERGVDAIQIVMTNNIDLMILDLALPDMSGIEVLAEVRKKRENLAVIVLTSRGMKETVVKTAMLGVTAYMVKPIELTIFKQRVKSIVTIPENVKVNKHAQRSKEILEELGKMDEMQVGLSPIIIELKKQIKGIASKLQNIEKEEVSKSKLEEAIWKKEVSCPICASTFITFNYRTKSLPVIKKEADFHEIYEIINPVAFDILVCPDCLYSAKKEDFENIEVKLIEKLAKDKQRRKKAAADMDFRAMRDYKIGIMSYKLAMMCYEHRKTTTAFLGSLFLKAAWLARENSDSALEMEFIKQVVDNYEASLSTGEKIGGQLSELGLIYLLGELYRRIGDIDKAMKYFMRVITDTESKTEKAILRMATDQLELIKDQKKEEKRKQDEKKVTVTKKK